jgi:hypothetical protein
MAENTSVQLNVKEALNAFKIINPAVEESGIVEQSSLYLFLDKHVIAYNDKISISYPFPLFPDLAVRAEDLFRVLTDLPEETAEVSLTDGKVLLLKTATTTAKLPVVPMDDKTRQLISGLRLGTLEQRLKGIPKEWMTALVLCGFSVSKDATDRIHSSIYVNENRLYSTDNLRISRFVMDETMQSEFLLPGTSAKVLTGFVGVNAYCPPEADDPWVHFTMESGVIFSSRVVRGQFPPCDEFFNVPDGKSVKLPPDTGAAVAAVVAFAPGEFDSDKKCMVEVKGRRVYCRAEDHGRSIERIVSTMVEEDITIPEFSINPIFLREILERAAVSTFGKDRALFTTDKFSHVMVLVA